MQTIDGLKLYNYIISGAENLIFNEHDLNEINVFPVADGDTGTNLALTMRNIISQAQQSDKADLTLDSISRIALANAYGNSGLIFAQYLYGLAIEAKNKEQLTVEEFVNISKRATDYAYEAVASPKEGTILTAMREWGNELEVNLQHDFEGIIDKSISKIADVVNQTKNKLKVLKDNNVVDAGAKAFLYFIEGINQFIKTGKLSFRRTKSLTDQGNHENNIKGEVVYRNKYCTQFSIISDKETSYFKNILAEYGDSLVVTKADDNVQIHLHTDTPDKVMKELVNEKNIISQKIDNIKFQSSVINNRKYRIGVITDSIADFDSEFIENEQICVVPLNIICDSISYFDKLTMTSEFFYQELDHFKMHPTSSQPTKQFIEQKLYFMLQHYDSVIAITVSKNMSGTYNNFIAAAEKLAYLDKKIDVIDSKVNSAAQGLLVRETIKYLKTGMPHEEIVQKINALKEKTRIYVSVKTLKYMLKGGRVSKVKGAILSRIKLKPVVSIDEKGHGSIFKPTLTQNGAVKQILRKIEKDARSEGILRYSIVYSDSKDQIDSFMKQLIKITGKQPEFIVPISPIVGLNAGKGSFAVAYIKGVE
ncbi:MAG: DegV family EDD domain-containing protein [Clostridia bacterium]|nr:DegV family EDD domain-containing protein [Clostridia bacterium]